MTFAENLKKREHTGPISTLLNRKDIGQNCMWLTSVLFWCMVYFIVKYITTYRLWVYMSSVGKALKNGLDNI